MGDYSFLAWSPAISVVVWFGLTTYLVYHQRYRTWTEIFFVGLSASVGAYALSDLFFFGLSARTYALVAASASLWSLTFAGFFLFLYGLTLYGRFRRVLLLVLVPTAFFIITIPENMFLPGDQGFTALPGGSPFVPVYNLSWFIPWVLVSGALWLGGLYGLSRTYLEVREQNRKLGRRIAVIFLGIVIAFVAGASSNGVLALGNITAPPLFSTFLALPGILIFFAMTPVTFRRLNDAILLRKASDYDVKAAFLTFSDGTLIGSKTVPEESMIDPDSFSSMLDVIQNFMHASFPTLRGKWLQSIRHGDYTLVMERGKYAYVTLVLGGTENDQLRRHAIERLETFEAANAAVLENWRGVAKDATGVDDTLTSLLSGP